MKKENNIIMQMENDKIMSCIKFLPFNITSIGTSCDGRSLKYDITADTSYGKNVISVEFSKDTLIENKQKENEISPKYKYLYMLAKAIEEKYDKKLETLLKDDNDNDSRLNEKTIRTAIIIHARISLLVEQLENLKK